MAADFVLNVVAGVVAVAGGAGVGRADVLGILLGTGDAAAGVAGVAGVADAAGSADVVAAVCCVACSVTVADVPAAACCIVCSVDVAAAAAAALPKGPDPARQICFSRRRQDCDIETMSSLLPTTTPPTSLTVAAKQNRYRRLRHPLAVRALSVLHRL